MDPSSTSLPTPAAPAPAAAPPRPALRDVTNEYRVADLLSEIEGVRLPGPGWEHATVDRALLSEALATLAEVADGHAADDQVPVALRVGPAGLELTIRCERAWETAVVAVASDAVLAGAAPLGALRDAVAAVRDAEVLVASDGTRLQVGSTVLDGGTLAVTPPRPRGGPSAVRRVQLPPGLPAGIALRLDSVNLVVPDQLRARFGRRRISMTTLYEDDGTWLLSGIADGSPMVVVTGEVAVY